MSPAAHAVDIMPQAVWILSSASRKPRQRIGIVRHRSALGNARDDDLLAPLHRIQQTDFVSRLLDPGLRPRPLVLGEEIELVGTDLDGDLAVVLVLIARHDFRLALGAAFRPIVDEEIDGIALDLGRLLRTGLGQRITDLAVAGSVRVGGPGIGTAQQGRIVGLGGRERRNRGAGGDHGGNGQASGQSEHVAPQRQGWDGVCGRILLANSGVYMVASGRTILAPAALRPWRGEVNVRSGSSQPSPARTPASTSGKRSLPKKSSSPDEEGRAAEDAAVDGLGGVAHQLVFDLRGLGCRNQAVGIEACFEKRGANHSGSFICGRSPTSADHGIRIARQLAGHLNGGRGAHDRRAC